MLLHKQAKVSPNRGMPVELTTITKKLNDITAETVQLYFNDWGVYTADAWEAIGTVVIWKFVYTNILDANGFKLGQKDDTSVSFSSTALTTEVDAPDWVFEATDDLTVLERLNNITAGLSNWEYMIDYRGWVIYWKKASTTTTLTSTAYKVNSLLITATA